MASLENILSFVISINVKKLVIKTRLHSKNKKKGTEELLSGRNDICKLVKIWGVDKCCFSSF